MTQKDTLTSVMNQAIRNRLAEVRKATPGTVVDYDFRTQKATVVPTIRRKYADNKVEDFPPISNVPVIFPRSGGASFTFPVNPGDPVLLLFCDRSLDAWLGGSQEPDDNRMHSLNDAVAIPGLIPFVMTSQARNNEDVLLSFKGNEVELTPDGQMNLRCPERVTIDCPEVKITGDLRVKGDIYDLDDEYGTFNRIRTVYNSHTHPENDDGGPTSVPNQQLGEV